MPSTVMVSLVTTRRQSGCAVANFVENMANRYGKDNVFVLNVRTVGATVL